MIPDETLLVVVSGTLCLFYEFGTGDINMLLFVDVTTVSAKLADGLKER